MDTIHHNFLQNIYDHQLITFYFFGRISTLRKRFLNSFKYFLALAFFSILRIISPLFRSLRFPSSPMLLAKCSRFLSSPSTCPLFTLFYNHSSIYNKYKLIICFFLRLKCYKNFVRIENIVYHGIETHYRYIYIYIILK